MKLQTVKIHPTCSIISVTLIMKHPRDYRGTEKERSKGRV